MSQDEIIAEYIFVILLVLGGTAIAWVLGIAFVEWFKGFFTPEELEQMKFNRQEK